MKDGITQQSDTPKAVFNHPGNIFVAGFIGSPQMNFFNDCKLALENGIYFVEICEKKYKLPDEKQRMLLKRNMQSCKVTLGVRPENVLLCSEQDAGTITGTLEVTELMGSEMHVHVKVEGHIIVMKISRPEVMNELTFDVKSQKNIYFKPESNRIHIFDSESGNNLCC